MSLIFFFPTLMFCLEAVPEVHIDARITPNLSLFFPSSTPPVRLPRVTQGRLADAVDAQGEMWLKNDTVNLHYTCTNATVSYIDEIRSPVAAYRVFVACGPVACGDLCQLPRGTCENGVCRCEKHWFGRECTHGMFLNDPTVCPGEVLRGRYAAIDVETNAGLSWVLFTPVGYMNDHSSFEFGAYFYVGTGLGLSQSNLDPVDGIVEVWVDMALFFPPGIVVADFFERDSYDLMGSVNVTIREYDDPMCATARVYKEPDWTCPAPTTLEMLPVEEKSVGKIDLSNLGPEDVYDYDENDLSMIAELGKTLPVIENVCLACFDGACVCPPQTMGFACNLGCPRGLQVMKLGDESVEIGLIGYDVLSRCEWLLDATELYDQVTEVGNILELDMIVHEWGLGAGDRVDLHDMVSRSTVGQLVRSLLSPDSEMGIEKRARIVARPTSGLFLVRLLADAVLSGPGFLIEVQARVVDVPVEPPNNTALIVVVSVMGMLLCIVLAGVFLWFWRRKQALTRAAALTVTADKQTPVEEDAELPTTEAFDESELECSVSRLTFGMPRASAVPVGKWLTETVTLFNASDGRRRFAFKVPAIPASKQFECTIVPGKGSLGPQEECAIEVRFRLDMSCKVNKRVMLEAVGYGVRFLPMNVKGELSDRIDPDEVEILDDEPLGVGGFGTVYRGRYRGTMVAAKVLNEQNALIMADTNSFEHEVGLLRQLRHACIVRFVGASHVQGKLMICTELLIKGTVTALLEREPSLPYALKLSFCADLASALEFLHTKGILYRDVKTDNLLVVSVSVSAQVHAKLTDFGTARNVADIQEPAVHTANIGTPPYMAPELIDAQPFNCKVDCYALGIVCFEIFTQTVAWHETKIWELPRAVMTGGRPVLPKDTPSEFRSLVEALWAQEANDRPDAKEASAVLKRLALGARNARS